MRIAVWGLGYCGLVNAAGLAALGHEVTGVEIDRGVVEALGHYRVGIVEPGLDDLVRQTTRSGRLRACHASSGAWEQAAVSLICVDTPVADDGNLDCANVLRALASIAESLLRRPRFHVIAVRSTVPARFLRDHALAAMKRHGLGDPGEGYGLAMVPEFLREGQALADFQRPSFSVIGALDGGSAALLTELLTPFQAPVLVVEPEEAEVLKLVNNAFHAMKVTFANEVGRLCGAIGADAQRVMGILASDRTLNLSAAYLRPGEAFGGPCLGKDLSALRRIGLGHAVDLPLLEAIGRSNDAHVAACFETIAGTPAACIGFLGLTFKVGTDDLRQSRALEIAARLRRAGRRVLAFDTNLSGQPLGERQRQLLNQAFDGAEDGLVGRMDDLLPACGLIVVAHPCETYRAFAATHRSGGATFLDLCDGSLFRETRSSTTGPSAGTDGGSVPGSAAGEPTWRDRV